MAGISGKGGWSGELEKSTKSPSWAGVGVGLSFATQQKEVSQTNPQYQDLQEQPKQIAYWTKSLYLRDIPILVNISTPLGCILYTDFLSY